MHRVLPSDCKKKEELEAERESKILNGRTRRFEVEELVWVQVDDTKLWSPGMVVEVFDNSPLYTVRVENRLIKKHVNHLKPRVARREVDLGMYGTGSRVDRPLERVAGMPGTGFRVDRPLERVSVQQDASNSEEQERERPLRRTGFQRLKPVIELTKSPPDLCKSPGIVEQGSELCGEGPSVTALSEPPTVAPPVPRELRLLQSSLLGGEDSFMNNEPESQGLRRSKRLNNRAN